MRHVHADGLAVSRVALQRFNMDHALQGGRFSNARQAVRLRVEQEFAPALARSWEEGG